MLVSSELQMSRTIVELLLAIHSNPAMNLRFEQEDADLTPRIITYRYYYMY